MGKKILKKLEKYYWENFLKEDEKDVIYTKKEFFATCLKNFAYDFSPKCGFFGLSKKERTRKNSIEFLITKELVKDKEEAKEFIRIFKDKQICINTNCYFTFEEYLTPDFKRVYKARFKHTSG